MNYISTTQAAAGWGISANRIVKLINAGRIPGAKQIGYRWMIPANTEKPSDARTREMRSAKSKKPLPAFRYPAFEYADAASFSPPLCDEEIVLKQASEALYACRFEEAEKVLGRLCETTEDRYRRIAALRISCTASLFLNKGRQFLESYGRLSAELYEDFPYKPEMRELIHELDATLGDVSYFSGRFRVEPDYEYHESFLPHLGALCAISVFFSAGRGLKPGMLTPCELNCALLDKVGNYADIQSMHLYLGCTYSIMRKNEEAEAHLRRALELAEKYELFYAVATEYYYMEEAFEQALSGFSEQFRTHLRRLSEDIHSRYVLFMDTVSMDSIFKLLPRSEYVYIIYAVQGLSNSEAAKLMNIPKRKISRRYNEIYDKLGVKDRAELVALYCESSEGNKP